jgi:hypothetical protein
VIDTRSGTRPGPPAGIDWADLAEDKIAAIPLLRALEAEQRGRVRDQAGQGRGTSARD